MRNNLNFQTVYAKTNRRKHSIAVLGPVLWNETPQHVKSSLSFPIFKTMFKKWYWNSKLDRLNL